jgi:hypothetical protein
MNILNDHSSNHKIEISGLEEKIEPEPISTEMPFIQAIFETLLCNGKRVFFKGRFTKRVYLAIGKRRKYFAVANIFGWIQEKLT